MLVLMLVLMVMLMVMLMVVAEEEVLTQRPSVYLTEKHHSYPPSVPLVPSHLPSPPPD